MSRKPSEWRATARGKYLENHESDPQLKLDSEEWFKWLEENTSFKYVPNNDDKVIRMNLSLNKRVNNYWYASRRYGGRTRQFYIGNKVKLTFENLQKIAYLLALKQEDYDHFKGKKAASMIDRIDVVKFN